VQAVDATTAHTLAATQTVIDREQLLREIARVRESRPPSAGVDGSRNPRIVGERCE
jgi:hypothetical protein